MEAYMKKNESGETENQGTPDAVYTRSDAPIFCAIEDHAKNLNVSAPIFAAVKTARGWAAGKSVDKSEFEKAVKSFLGSPIGGK
jgi:hypothetical protein